MATPYNPNRHIDNQDYEFDYFDDDNAEDLSYSELDAFPEFLLERAPLLKSLQLDHNQITVLPRCISSFSNLVALDISNNGMTYMSADIARLSKLKSLTARNNRFDCESLPKELGSMTSLQVVNLSGNSIEDFPLQFTQLVNLRCLYLGANQLSTLPEEIGNLQRLQILYLGGNKLESVPHSVGYMSRLQSLILCDNKLQSLPHTIANLASLQSLSLHSNKLATLPPELIKLELVELSLRNNPLVMKFVEDLIYDPPSLLELAGRTVKIKNIAYSPADVPLSLCKYLDSAQRCVNPKCKGVYFSSKVKNVNFVDFCGKYRLPLLEYLCSPNCKRSPVICASSDSESEDELAPMAAKMKKVLLG